MKDFTKYVLLAAAFTFVPLYAMAEVTVKDTTSREFIHNQGYSSEVSRIIEVKTVDPMTPIAAKEEKHPRWKAFGWTLLETIDPTWERPNDFVNHDTKYDKYRTDDL